MDKLKYKTALVNELKAKTLSDNMTDKEAFFNIYCEKLEEAEIIEDFHYLYFMGKGKRNSTVQIDGYAYFELDKRLTLFIIPPLSFYEEKILSKSESAVYFKRALSYYLDREKVIEGIEDSSEGYGLAKDLINKKMLVERIEIIILTDYEISQRIDNIYDDEINDIKVSYSIFDITRVKLMDESQSGKEDLIIDLKKEFDCDGIQVLPASETKEYKAYLANIQGEILAKMYDKYQSRLLEGNVRSFLQTRGKVNKGIRVTILNNPEMFFAYNNGIAATAEELFFEERESGLYIVGFKSLQIVNGGQTTASLANAWTNDVRHNSREQISKIYVPMKISVVNTEIGMDLIPNISRYANSQNKVSEADLASNHNFHIKMEEISRRIIAPAINGNQFGTYWYYERANGQYRQETYKKTEANKKNFELKNPKKQMFKKVDLAKWYNIYLCKPHIASAGSQKSFMEFSKWMVTKWDKNENQFNDLYFKKIVSIGILFKSADKIIKEQEWYQSYKANIVAYTISAIINKSKEEYKNDEIDFMKIWKNQDISIAWFKEIKKVSYIMYNHLISEQRTVENVTEWAKREICWNIAKKIPFDFSEEFVDELLNKDIIETDRYAAKREDKENIEFNALIEMCEYGESYWKEVSAWGMLEDIWNHQDKDFLKLAMNFETSGKIPTDKQAIKILELLKKARIEGYKK